MAILPPPPIPANNHPPTLHLQTVFGFKKKTVEKLIKFNSWGLSLLDNGKEYNVLIKAKFSSGSPVGLCFF